MILGEIEYTALRTAEGRFVSYSQAVKTEDGWKESGTAVLLESVSVQEEQVQRQGDLFVLKDDPQVRVDSRAHKMSKSRGNVVNPDQIVKEYGADALRLSEMFMGPLEATKPWSMSGVGGVRSFLDRAWRMIVDPKEDQVRLSESVQDVAPTEGQMRMLHATIAAVTRDLEQMGFNTAIARLMEFVNFYTKEAVRPRVAMEQFVLLLAPLAPHLAEELWECLGHDQSLAYHSWPVHDPRWLEASEIEVP
ncbi:MAG: class I tRNA ligase family protein, partial [bacterium]